MPNRAPLWMFRWATAGALAVTFLSTPEAQQAPAAPSASPASSSSGAPYNTLVSTYCLSCHNNKTKAGGLELDAINGQAPGDHWAIWEKVDRKLRARQMPPPGARRPDEADRLAALNS